MFGLVEVTLSVPAVMVKRLAIPNTALVDNCRDVPFKVTLNKFALPFNVLLPVNVAVPAVAVRLPLTSSEVLKVKDEVVVIFPDAFNAYRLIVPLPLIDLELPVKLILPAVDVRLPATDKLPLIVRLLEVLIVPEQVRLSNTIPEPAILFVVPLMVKVPGELCMSEPAPVVIKLPPTVMFVLAVIELPDAETVKSLNE